MSPHQNPNANPNYSTTATCGCVEGFFRAMKWCFCGCFRPKNAREIGHEGRPGRPLPVDPKKPQAHLAAAPTKLVIQQEMFSSPKYSNKKPKDKYELGAVIATGGFASVVEARCKSTGQMYACKIMSLPKLGQKISEEEMSRDDIFREIHISAGLSHPNVVPLVEFFIGKNEVHLIFEYMQGGRLLEVVLKPLSENQARQVFKQLCEGIKYLHSQNVVHRDLKLENVLLERPNDLDSVRIADFGLAKQTTKPLQTMCGTLSYVAPDVITERKDKKYEKSVDMWSAGVLLYILLSGQQPFTGSQSQMWDKILKGDYNFGHPVWRKTSKSAKDFVCRLLEINSDRRLTAEKALLDAWMQE